MLFKNISILDENYEILEDTNLIVEGEIITYIGNDVPKDYNGDVYEGDNKLLLPDFYNIHSHIPMTLLRGYGEGLLLDIWLFEKMVPFEAKMIPEDCYWGSMLGAIEQIKSGVVSISDMYLHLEEMVRAFEDNGLKLNLSQGTSSADKGKNFFDTISYRDTSSLMKIYNGKPGRIKMDMGLHAEYTSNPVLVSEVAAYAKENNLIIHTHLS